MTKPLRKPAYECEILFTPDRHTDQVPSLQKPLRLGLTFNLVGGPQATARGDRTNA